jgi:Icc-related predicted phosphoesterase
MRILTISDKIIDSIHSPAITSIARGIDLVLSCGDLPADYLEYIVSMLNVPLFFVMGNHGSDGGEKIYPDGCENMDSRIIHHNGLLIAGFEGSIRYNNRPKFQYTESEMSAKVATLTPSLVMNRARYGRYLDILITHAPPFHIHDAEDLPHHGFKSFTWFIDQYKPRYHFHGHTHVYDNRQETTTQHGTTTIINTYGYKILDIEVIKPRRPK